MPNPRATARVTRPVDPPNATPAFTKATKNVGYAGSTSALVYADVDGLVPLLQGLAGLAGGTTSGLDDVTKALGAVDSFALNVQSEGIEAKLDGFLAVP